MTGAYDSHALDRRFELINRRFERIEAHLAVLSEKLGVPYVIESESLPRDVVELARAGKKLDAMKRYRELTGATFEEARDVVSGL